MAYIDTMSISRASTRTCEGVTKGMGYVTQASHCFSWGISSRHQAEYWPYSQKLEPGLTGEVTIQPSRAPHLDFSCAVLHIHRPCARKRWRGIDAWIGRSCWRISQGRSIKS